MLWFVIILVNEDDTDPVDKLIYNTIRDQSLNLSCPSSNEDRICDSIYHLGRSLILYKNWSFTSDGQNDISKTTNIDLNRHIDDDIYKRTFIDVINNSIKHKKYTNEMKQLLIKIVHENTANISKINTFLGFKDKKEFTSILKKHASLSPAFGIRIYNNIIKSLQKQAQVKEFDHLLTDLDSNRLRREYQHVLNVHIDTDNVKSIENTFRFFNNIVHADDLPTAISECKSVKRSRHRREKPDKKEQEPQIHQRKDQHSRRILQNKDVSALQKFDNQLLLDTIHVFLVHSNWKDFVQSQSNTKSNISSKLKIDTIINKDKYVTKSDNSGSYGFGVDHRFVHLCIIDDLLCKIDIVCVVCQLYTDILI